MLDCITLTFVIWEPEDEAMVSGEHLTASSLRNSLCCVVSSSVLFWGTWELFSISFQRKEDEIKSQILSQSQEVQHLGLENETFHSTLFPNLKKIKIEGIEILLSSFNKNLGKFQSEITVCIIQVILSVTEIHLVFT